MTRAIGNEINTALRLGQRAACNRSSPGSFRRFVQRLLAVRADDHALELGVGLGEQLLPVAAKAQRVVGIDISAELVAALRGRLEGQNTQVVVGDMDDLGALGLDGPFTLGYAVYSIYYSRDPVGVLRTLAGMLSGARARCVVVAPDLDNNKGWYADLGQLYPLPEAVLSLAGICRDVVLPACLDLFPSVRCETFRSHVHFEDLDELMRYYDACEPYCRPEQRDEARSLFAQKFARDGGYRIFKRSLGIVARSRR